MQLWIASLIVLLVALLFVLGDRKLGGDERSALSRYLLSGREEGAAARAAPAAFLSWFDALLRVRVVHVAGRYPLHLPSFRRSVLLSTVALGFAAAMWAAKKGFFDAENLDAGLLNAKVGLPLFVMYALGAVVSNFVPDYLSLVQSRFVLERMRRTDRVLAQLGWLVLDLVLTAATVFAVLWLTARLLMPLVPSNYEHFVGCLRGEDLTFAEFARIYWGGLSFSSPAGTQNYDAAGIYIYSSFLTSFWVWLFMASTLLVKLSVFVPGLRRFLADEVRVQRHPVRALSLAAAMVATAMLGFGSLSSSERPGNEREGWVDGQQSWHESIERCHERRAQRQRAAWRYYDQLPPPR